MQEPSPRKSRLAIAAGLVAAVVIGGLGFLIGRGSVAEREVAAPAAMPTIAPERPKVGPLALERAELLALADSAADAAASGGDASAQVTAMAGRRFDLVLPFGCDGPDDPKSTADLRWHYEPDQKTLRISVNPERWPVEEWGLAPAASDDAMLQGFWIPRPWSSATRCPEIAAARPTPSPMATPAKALAPAPSTSATAPAPVEAAEHTLAIARLVKDDRSARSRPFEIVQRIDLDGADQARGFRLRVIGRIDPASGMAPIRCIQPGGAQQRPRCLIAATFTELRIENPLDNKVLATWPLGELERGVD